jgi:hypothetical protein
MCLAEPFSLFINFSKPKYFIIPFLLHPRVGRFLSVTPLTKSYPMITPYQFSENSPISGIDLDGEEFRYYLINMVQQNGSVVLVKPSF